MPTILFSLFNLKVTKNMGPSPSQSKPQQDTDTEPLVINHPRFNNLKVIRLPTQDDQGAMQVTVALPNQTEYKRWIKQVEEITETENLFMPIGKEFQKTQFCGSGGISTVTFRYYPYLLKDEIANRCKMEGKCFEEAELWYLVFSMIQAAKSFHKAGKKVGDVRPLNVFISPQGQVRVATQISWPNEQTNYLKTVFEKEPTYLSPEELKDIGFGKLEESANFALNEAFSVGLTCLDAATLTDSASLYELNNKFNYAQLDQRLEQLEAVGNYSGPLVLLIKGLCQVEPEKRLTCKELAEWLEKYEGSIIELQEFSITELPEKLYRLTQPQRPQSQIQPQYQPPQSQFQIPGKPQAPPQFYPQPQYQPQIPSNFVSAPVGRPQPKITQVSIVNPGYVPRQYIPGQLPYNQELSGYSGSGVNRTVDYQTSVNRGNINLQQIDEQLQMSRKLFPS